MDLKFNIEQTCDLKHYVVQINCTGEEDGWVDITQDFDTQEDAIEWTQKLKFGFTVYVDVPF